MQREILESEPSAELRVYAVWVPFSGGTSEAADVSRRVLPDSRVMQFWDGSTRLFAGHGPVLMAMEEVESNPYLPLGIL